MSRPISRLAAIAIAIAIGSVVTACSTPATRSTAPTPIEPLTTPTSTAATIEDEVARETRKTAAEQLECPEDQLTVACTRRDVHGGCIAIQAKGCGKVLDYDFGNE